MNTNSQAKGVLSRNPPVTRAPSQPPIGADAPKKAKLRFLAKPGGFVIPIMATAFGIINAPPMPDIARIVLKATKLLQNPHTNVNTMRTRLPTISMFLCPYTAPKRPLMRTKVPCVRLIHVNNC